MQEIPSQRHCPGPSQKPEEPKERLQAETSALLFHCITSMDHCSLTWCLHGTTFKHHATHTTLGGVFVCFVYLGFFLVFVLLWFCLCFFNLFFNPEIPHMLLVSCNMRLFNWWMDTWNIQNLKADWKMHFYALSLKEKVPTPKWNSLLQASYGSGTTNVPAKATGRKAHTAKIKY